MGLADVQVGVSGRTTDFDSSRRDDFPTVANSDSARGFLFHWRNHEVFKLDSTLQ